FIGTPPVNLFAAKVSADGGSVHLEGAAWSVGEEQRLVLAGRAGASVTVGVRPEDLRAAPDGATGVPAKVELVEPLGSETLVHWTSGGASHVSRVTSGAAPEVGAGARLTARPDAVLLFDPASGASLLATADRA